MEDFTEVYQFYSKSYDEDNFGMGLPQWRKLLSNFAIVEGGLTFNGVKYPTVEHAFQGAKMQFTQRPTDVICFSEGTMTAIEAKSAGGKAGMKKMGLTMDVKEWNKACDGVMYEVLVARYDADPTFRRILEEFAKPGKVLLHFERNGGYWGGKLKEGEIVGENRLGKMLMALAKRN